MSHVDQIWPALSALRRGELPQPAGVDALVALARGECEAPKQPRLFSDGEIAPLQREWCAAYEDENLAPCPALSPSALSALRGAERDMPGSSRFYGHFFRWIQEAGKSSPKWAGSISPHPVKFRERLATVAAWAGPRLAAQAAAERARADVERAEGRACDREGCPQCEAPAGGFAELRRKLAQSTNYGPPCSESTARKGGGE